MWLLCILVQCSGKKYSVTHAQPCGAEIKPWNDQWTASVGVKAARGGSSCCVVGHLTRPNLIARSAVLGIHTSPSRSSHRAGPFSCKARSLSTLPETILQVTGNLSGGFFIYEHLRTLSLIRQMCVSTCGWRGKGGGWWPLAQDVPAQCYVPTGDSSGIGSRGFELVI